MCSALLQTCTCKYFVNSCNIFSRKLLNLSQICDNGRGRLKKKLLSLNAKFTMNRFTMYLGLFLSSYIFESLQPADIYSLWGHQNVYSANTFRPVLDTASCGPCCCYKKSFFQASIYKNGSCINLVKKLLITSQLFINRHAKKWIDGKKVYSPNIVCHSYDIIHDKKKPEIFLPLKAMTYFQKLARPFSLSWLKLKVPTFLSSSACILLLVDE